MGNQQERQLDLNLEGLNISSIRLHKKVLDGSLGKKIQFIAMMHIHSRQEIYDTFNFTTMSVQNAVVLKLYQEYAKLPLPKGFVITVLYGNSNYAVNKDGVVIEVQTRRILTPYVDDNGYYRVNARHTSPTGKQAIYIRLHRLIAMTFLPLAGAFNEYTIDHKDCNKLNNTLGNLEWVTRKENVQRAYINGIVPAMQGERHGCSKLVDANVREIRTSLLTTKELASKFNCSFTTIRDIKRKVTWKHLL